MFFNSFDRNAPLSSRGPRRRINRRAAALALAVAATAPVVTLTAAQALAMTEIDQALVLLAEQARPTDAQLLASGVEQYAKGQYEDAQATLQQVKADALPNTDKAKLTDALNKVEAALAERKKARAEYEMGEQALTAKNNTEAMRHFRAAADNRFADATTRNQAANQMQAAESGIKAAQQDLKSLYRQAVADEKAGKLDVAREKFVKLAAANYKVGLFEKSPQNFIRDIDHQMAQAKAAELAKVEEARKAELAKAEAAAQAETEAARKAELAKAEAARKAELARSGQTAAAAPAETTHVAPVTPAPEVARTSNAQAQPIEPTKRSPKQAYDEGVAAFRKGEWTLAQASFQEAQDAGYKPGLFKDSPSQYLRRIDQKVQAQAAPSAMPAETVATTVAAPMTMPALTPEQRDLQETARLEKARLEQRQYEADQIVQRAAQAQKENRLGDAYFLYSQAVALDPNSKAAVEGKNALQPLITGTEARPLIERQTDLIRIRREIITYRFDQAIANARKAIDEGRYSDAQREIDSAIVAKEADPSLFNPQELNRFDTVLATTRVTLAKASEATTTQQRENAAQAALSDAQARAQQEQIEKRRTVQALAHTAQQKVYEGQYDQALGIINQILAIDPSNDYAVGVKQLVQDYAVIQQQRSIREKMEREMLTTLNSAEERKIPYLDIMNYPVNWPDISEMRDRYVQEERSGGVVSDDAEAQSRLDLKLPMVNFDQAPLAEVVDFLRDVSGANIYVNWRTMESAGVNRDALVSAKLHDVRLSIALKKILADVSGGQVKLGYAIEDGVLTISTADDLNKSTVTQVYDIRDLLVTAPDFADPTGTASRRAAQNDSNPAHAPAGFTGGSWTGSNVSPSASSSTWGGSGLANTTIANGVPTTIKELKTQQLVDDITSIIKETVDRNSWSENGGPGALKYLSGQLIATQTPDNQRQVGSLLEKLRMTKAIQVSVETRFLTVSRNFMEDIGVDLDFFFNLNPGKFTPIPVIQNSSDFTLNPQTPVPGSIGASGTTLSPAMNVQGSFLDAFQVNFLLRATQASRHTSVVNAPRVTVFNGQQALIVVGRETSYVADIQAVTGASVAAYNPVPDTVLSGVQLSVTPTVSADRKYVTLTLNPQVSNLVELKNFPVQSIVQVNNGVGTPGELIPQTAYIQLPIMDTTQVTTIVSVPDGGTLLLGGQTIAGETELEEGVPILSKIPFLKRLFTNRSTAKDETVLLILVKPSILIHREIEANSFPLMGAK